MSIILKAVTVNVFDQQTPAFPAWIVENGYWLDFR
jgi:hypothetical protein